MEDKKINEMNYNELADLLLEHPEMVNEIVDKVDSFHQLSNAVSSMFINTTISANKNPYTIEHNQKVQKILSALTEYEYSDDRKASKPKELTAEKKEELRDDLDGYINLGYPPDKLEDYCTKRGYNLNEVYNTNELVERYSDYGITYDPKEGSLNAPWFSQTRYFTPSLQQSKEAQKESKLSAKEAELSALEAEEQEITENEASLDKETGKDEI